MEYDPIKLKLAKILKRNPFLRGLFHKSLDLMFLRSWYVGRELRRMRASFKPGANVLDAGTGFGQYSDRIKRMYPNVSIAALELERDHLYGVEDYFKKVHPDISILLGDVQSLPLAEQTFDVIVSVDVMEHVLNDEETFAEFNRILRPGGMFLMHTPRDLSPVGTIDHDHSDDSERWTVGEHVRDGYRDADAVRKLDAAGLKVVRKVNGYGIMGKIGWTLMQRIPLGWLSKGMLWILPTLIYMVAAIPIGMLAMWIDYTIGNHAYGGSLLIIAQKPTDD